MPFTLSETAQIQYLKSFLMEDKDLFILLILQVKYHYCDDNMVM